MSEQTIDQALVRLIDDIQAMRDAPWSMADPPLLVPEMKRAAEYLHANKALILHSFDAWDRTPKSELSALASQHRELDGSAADHSFGPIARMAVEEAEEIVTVGSGMATLTDDNLHMLQRVLQYAKYLTQTEDQ